MNKPFVEFVDQEPIFSRGIRQALYWAYAMQMPTVNPHERSPHAVLMEKQQDGYIEPFHLSSINLKGMDSLQRYAEAGNIRRRVEELTTERQRHVIWAKYICDINVPEKMLGMLYVVRTLAPRMKRSKGLIADILWHVVCTEIQREHCTTEAIGQIHHVSDRAVRYGRVTIEKILGGIEKEVFLKIKPVFSEGGYI